MSDRAAQKRWSIPEIAEDVAVDKEEVETGRVRVRKQVHRRDEEIALDLLTQEVRVDRIPVNRPVRDGSHPPQPRYEGQTLIIPLLEEQIVVQKRLVVREELRISRVTSRRRHRELVPLRQEHAEVDRLPPA